MDFEKMTTEQRAALPPQIKLRLAMVRQEEHAAAFRARLGYAGDPRVMGDAAGQAVRTDSEVSE